MSCRVRSCYSLMSICHLVGASYGGNNANQFLQWTSFGTPYPVVQDYSPPPPLPECSCLCQSYHCNSRPYIYAPSTSALKSGRKRKVHYEDENMHETTHHSERKKLEWHRHENQHRHSTDSPSPQMCRSLSHNRQGVKRKMADVQRWGHPERDYDYYQSLHEDRKRKRVSFESPFTSYRGIWTQRDSQWVYQKTTQDGDSHSHYFERSH